MEQFRINNVVQYQRRHIERFIEKGTLSPDWYQAKVLEVYTDYLTVINKEGKEVTLHKAFPVEITYEILEECGFTQAEGYYYLPLAIGKDVYLVFPKSGNKHTQTFCIGLGKYPGWQLTIVNSLFTSLHNLMNFYFSLTGRELVWSEWPLTAKELVKPRAGLTILKNFLPPGDDDVTAI